MDQSLDIRILWWLSTTVQLWIAWKIYQSPLKQSFPYFAIYLATSSFYNIFISLIDSLSSDRNLFGYAFLVWTYSSSLLEFLVLLELSSTALSRFPAIKKASGRTLSFFWTGLTLICGAWFLYLNSLPTKQSLSLLMQGIRYQEAVSLCFTLFVFLFLAFVAWMPVPLQSNMLNHCFLMGGYFLALTLSRFSVELGNFATQQRIADYVGLIGVLVVLIAWLIRIKLVDDSKLTTPKGPLNDSEAQILLARLDELNQSLSKSRPKVIR